MREAFPFHDVIMTYTVVRYDIDSPKHIQDW